MKGIQVIRLLDALPVNNVQIAAGVTPLSVIIQGEDFRNVESVLLNGFEAPEFVVMSRTRIIAQVPDAIRLAALTDIVVLSFNLTLTERSLVEFTVGRKIRSIQGIPRLMQVFLRQLLRTPGSNVFHPQSGGGLMRQVGGNITERSAADIQIAIDRTRRYITSVQAATPRMPPEERLLSAEIAGLFVNPADTSINVTIVLTSHTGQRAGAALEA